MGVATTERELIISCGFLIFRRKAELEFLLMKHADRWDIPKGHLDPGETLLECAYRELVEETGIARHQVRQADSFEFVHDYEVRLKRFGLEPRPKRLVVYGGVLTEPVKIKATEHEGHRWVPWQPPHRIQEKTIDPLLDYAAGFAAHPEWNTILAG